MQSKLDNYIIWLYPLTTLNQALRIHIYYKFSIIIIIYSKIGKCFNEDKDMINNEPFAVYTLFKDNSAVV